MEGAPSLRYTRARLRRGRGGYAGALRASVVSVHRRITRVYTHAQDLTVTRGARMARLDAWLWSVRLFKTRSAATAACRGGHIRVNDAPAKAAQLVATGDTVRVRRSGEETIVEVLNPTLSKRVGAPVAQQAYLDHTPTQPPPIAAMVSKVAVRDRGAGRPTKKQRRDMDAFLGRG